MEDMLMENMLRLMKWLAIVWLTAIAVVGLGGALILAYSFHPAIAFVIAIFPGIPYSLLVGTFIKEII